MLEEAELQLRRNSPNIDMIKKYLAKENKSPKEQKRIIQDFVKKVIVYDDNVKINFIVDLDGGGGGIRTHVLPGSYFSFYEFSLFLLFITLPPTDRV